MKKVAEWSEVRSLFQGSFMSYLTGLYLLAHYLELADRCPQLQAIRFHFTFGAVLFFLSLIKISKNKIKKHTPLFKSTIAFIFVLGIYSVFSMDQSISLDYYVDRVLKFSMISLFIYASVDKPEDLRIIIVLLLIAWAKIAIEGVLGWATGSLVWQNQGIPRLHGSTSDTRHPNSFSGFAVSCLPFCIFLLAGVKHIGAKLLLLGLLLCALIIVVNTGSRTGYVAVVLGGALLFMKLKTNKVKAFFAAIAILIAAAIFVPQEYKERFESIYTGEEKEGHSSEKRMEIMADAIQVFLSYPLGVGVHAFPSVRQEMFGRKQDTHNLYLEVLTNVGIIGFVFFVVFLTRMIKLNRNLIDALHKQVNNDKDVDLNALFLLALSKATLGFVVMRLFLGLFGMDLYEIYWWLALGLILSVNKLMVKDIRGNIGWKLTNRNIY